MSNCEFRMSNESTDHVARFPHDALFGTVEFVR